jgi:hypothetical protein
MRPIEPECSWFHHSQTASVAFCVVMVWPEVKTALFYFLSFVNFQKIVTYVLYY